MPEIRRTSTLENAANALYEAGEFLTENEEWLIRLKQLEQTDPSWYEDEDNQGLIQFLQASEILIKLISALATVEEENPTESENPDIGSNLNSGGDAEEKNGVD